MWLCVEVLSLYLIFAPRCYSISTNVTTCLGSPAEFVCILNTTATVIWYIDGKDAVFEIGYAPTAAPYGAGEISILTLPGSQDYNGASVVCTESSNPAVSFVFYVQDPPAAPRNVNVSPINATSFKLFWEVPLQAQPNLLYLVEVRNGSGVVMYNDTTAESQIILTITDPCNQYVAIATSFYNLSKMCNGNSSRILLGVPPLDVKIQSTSFVFPMAPYDNVNITMSLAYQLQICYYDVYDLSGTSVLLVSSKKPLLFPEYEIVITLSPNKHFNLFISVYNAYGNTSLNMMLSTYDVIDVIANSSGLFCIFNPGSLARGCLVYLTNTDTNIVFCTMIERYINTLKNISWCNITSSASLSTGVYTVLVFDIKIDGTLSPTPAITGINLTIPVYPTFPAEPFVPTNVSSGSIAAAVIVSMIVIVLLIIAVIITIRIVQKKNVCTSQLHVCGDTTDGPTDRQNQVLQETYVNDTTPQHLRPNQVLQETNVDDTTLQHLEKERQLIAAAVNGDIKKVKRLCKAGVSPDATDKNGKSPLMYGSEYNYVKIVKFLLRQKANVDLMDECNWSALFYAVKYHHKEVVLLLVTKVSDVNVQDDKGRTALIHSCMEKGVEIVDLLLTSGANVNDTDYDGRSPLIHASTEGHIETVELLLKNGAATHIDEKDKNGRSALMNACEKGHLPVVEKLLNAKANVYLLDNDNKSARSLAKYEHKHDVVKLLNNRMNVVLLKENDIEVVWKEVASLADMWRILGLELRMNGLYLDLKIPSTTKSPRDSLKDMLQLWLSGNYDFERFGQPSWNSLCDAIEARTGCNNAVLASEIRIQHILPE